MRRIGELPGVRAPMFNSYHFKEFTVSFKGTAAETVNKALLSNRIQGGLPLAKSFPELGEAALYCVTEMHTKKDIDALVSGLREVLEV
jgi:glycine dehydrogenase subunit 1